MGILDAFADPQFRGDLRTGLFDLGKGASRAAGQSVTGLVDLITLGLRPFGYNVQAPIGSTAWAENRGAIPKANYTNQLAGLLGESVGGVAPMVVQAKAPQFAKGLLTLADNAMAPTPINAASRNQAGAIVWHGSPHKFDRFDASKIGTGEGAQAYGHGVYVAESPKVADEYAGKLSNPVVEFYRPPANPIEQEVLNAIQNRAITTQYGSRAQAAIDAWKDISNPVLDRLYGNAFLGIKPLPPDKLQKAIDMREAAKRLGEPSVYDTGHLYKVDLPDTAIANMLDWDKPLSQQAPAVRAAIQRTRSMLPPNALDDLGGDLSMLYGRDVGADSFLGTMNSLQPNLGESLLSRAGVPGVRYLDGGSRGAGVGTSNYVVFPGNEDLLTILERNGMKP